MLAAVVLVAIVAVCLLVMYFEWRDRNKHLHPH